MNFFADQSLDFLILLSLASAIVGGYRLGFLARVTSWAGLALGIAVGVVFLDDVARYFEEAEPGVALLASVAFLLAAGMLGQGLGLALGAALHASLPVGPGFRQYDRAAGGTLGAIGIISIFWLLTPALANVEGWPSEAAHDSVLLNVIS
ncbi:MAG TPA: CvpA family protein, partial [Acidimicrobiia bacterium]|nr:CvpA family protein [Acidimicrobiia bacterium]